MTEKPQPLIEEKIKTILLRVDINKYGKEKVVKLKDLKSAVEWVLKKIEETINTGHNMIKRRQDSISFEMKNKNYVEASELSSDITYYLGYLVALEDMKDLIKDAFSGVIEDGL